jgi:transcriptional regulator with XRE-family HTH domain
VLVRQELGTFLREKRRVLGVRREEVSALAGIGYDWYVRIEQGRGHASLDVLRRLAEALALDRAELAYVLALAGDGTPGAAPAAEDDLPPSVLRVVHAQEPRPAYVLNTRMDLLAWNGAACGFYDVEWGEIPGADRNLLWLMLTDDVLRARIVGWEDHTRRLVNHCRALWAGRSAEPAIAGLVQKVMAGSAEFRAWWTAPVPEVLDMLPIRKTVTDAEHGPLTVEQTAWLFGSRSDHILILSCPVDGDGDSTTAGLEGLARRRAER